MRYLLAAVNLGPATDTLADFAAHLALDLELDAVRLVHVRSLFPAHSAAPTSFLTEEQVLAGLQETAQRIRSVTQRWVRTEYEVHVGDLAEAVLRAGAGAELVLLGQSSNRGALRWLLGEASEGILEAATCPVLVVPPGMPWRAPERIALAVDDRPLSPVAIGRLRWLAARYGSALEVFHRDDGDAFTPAEEVATMLADLSYSYHHDKDGGRLVRYLTEAASEVGADWLAVIHHPRAAWREALSRNDSERVAEEAELPVLVLSERTAAARPRASASPASHELP